VDAGGPIPREAVGPLFDCATFLLGHKRFEDAVSTLDRIIGAAPDLGEAWHDRAEAYRLQGDWASAIRDYDQAIARDPNLALSYKGRAIAYVQGREDPIRGLIDIEKALSVRPLDAECHTWRGIALAKLGEYKEALWAYDKALALAPELTKVLCEKALCLSLLGRSHEALACTEQALLQEPSDPKVWYAEGLVLGSAGRWEEGLRAFQTALDIDPEYLDAWLNRAFALAALGRRREALSACDRALSSHPEVAAVWRTKAQVLTLMGDRRGATACLETAHKCGAEK
jgi:tetratricopeptide (TPR) repeat protein